MTSSEGGNHLIWAKGRGRGFRPKGPFLPSRRPGERPAVVEQLTPSSDGVKEQAGDDPQRVVGRGECSDVLPQEISKGQKCIAKFNYTANSDSPLGDPEVDLVQGEFVVVEEKHQGNELWRKVRKENGDKGFVPAKYIYRVEERITTLPWLANKQLKEETEAVSTVVKAPLKPYVSAYSKQQSQEVKLKQYYCSVCDKQLNGPQPYKAHMASKDHRLEVELAEEREG